MPVTIGILISPGHFPAVAPDKEPIRNRGFEYDYRLEYGDGGHDGKHAGAILPESLVWLWR
jgi:hypothetical protein